MVVGGIDVVVVVVARDVVGSVVVGSVACAEAEILHS